MLHFGSRISSPVRPIARGCLVTDLQMPGLSGQDLLDVLSARQAKLPAIMISGHGNIPAVVRAMESGAVGFLEKPFSMDVLKRQHS